MKIGYFVWVYISVLVIGGISVYDFQDRNLHNRVQERLSDIARQKVDQIQVWRSERLVDAQLLTGNRLLAEGLIQWLGGLPDPHILVELQSYLEPLRQPYGYFDYVLVDNQSNVRLNTFDPMAIGLDADTLAALYESWRSFQPVMTDLHQGQWYPVPYLSLVAPLFENLRPAGAIILFIDPRRQLIPLLQSRPYSGAAIETQLIRRDGNDVLSLQQANGQSVSIRPPLKLLDATVARAIEGAPGLIEGIDPNLQPVAAIALSVPNTPWILMVKVNHAEIFAPGRRDMWILDMGLLAIMGMVGLLVALAWQIRKRNDERLLREAESAERRSLEQFLNLFNQSLDAIFLLGIDFRLIDANPAAVTLLGYSREDLIRLQLPDILAEDERPHICEIAPRLLSGEVRQHEWLHKRKDGTTFPGEITAKVLNSDKFFATVRDISIRKHVERLNRELNEQLEKRVSERTAELNERTLELFKSQERFRLAMEVSSEGLWDGDLKSGKFYYSPGFFKMLGYAPDELPGNLETWVGLLHPEHRHDMLLKAKEMLRSGNIELECQMIDKEGRVHWILCRGAIVCWNARGEPIRAIGTHQDITDRKNILIALQNSEQQYRTLNNSLEHQVAERTAELNAANIAKNHFLAHMSHEIRTPMNAILGLTQILENEPHTETQGELLRKIIESGDFLLHIINDILDFSKIEAGHLSIEEQPFLLSKVIGRVDNLLRHKVIEKGLALHLPSINNDLDELMGDALRLEQVLLNLVSNAIKFTRHGEIKLIVTPFEDTDRAIVYRLEVHDTGIGIHPDVQDTLFHPFIQADNSISRRYGGTGLGLAISRRLVELMGGKLGVSSKPDKGSIFWFEIPFKRGSGYPLPHDKKNSDICTHPDYDLNGLRVLAVDDKRINLTILERALLQEGTSITLAMDGKEALEILQGSPKDFDVILMDVQMPVMDGLHATQEIKGNECLSHIPVIILSAGVFAEERLAAQKAGADDFLSKPINLSELKAVLSQYARTVDIQTHR